MCKGLNASGCRDSTETEEGSALSLRGVVREGSRWRNWGPDKGRAESRSWGLRPTSMEHLRMSVWGPCLLSICRLEFVACRGIHVGP